MSPVVPFPCSVVPVLYVGDDLGESTAGLLHERRIRVLVAASARRARRMLAHFRVAAIVFAAPDLAGLAAVADGSTPVIVLAGRDAKCNLENVTIVRRDTDPEDLAAVIHGLVSNRRHVARRDAA